MKKYLSFDGYCLKSMWDGLPPHDAVFISVGRLVNPSRSYIDCIYVSIYHSVSKGYGYTV